METTIIGSGNVAWRLAPALDNAGHIVKEVYSRNPDHAALLVKRLYQATAKKDLDFSNSTSELFIIAVADDAIEEIATEIVLPDNATVAHTSGSQPLSILGYLPTENIGVFYPLQTFSKSRKVDFSEVPVCIEGENQKTVDLLSEIAGSISRNVCRVNTSDRKVLHLAAVFSCNFVNHLFTIAKEIVERRGLDYEMLKPLIIETVGKSLDIGPENSQTGPAVRGDRAVMEEHQQFLLYNENLSYIYETLSKHITDTY